MGILLQDYHPVTTEMQDPKLPTIVILVMMVFSLEDVSGLKCEVGLGNATQVMECQGSWEKVKMMIKEEVGNNWEAVQNIDMSGLLDDIKNKVDDLKESLGNILQKTTGDSRRKREAEENPTAEPEPAEEYYCIKQSLGGTTVKSCMPKSVAAPLTTACSALSGTGTLCACNDQDVCNSSGFLSPS